jgi:hypothetical protein
MMCHTPRARVRAESVNRVYEHFRSVLKLVRRHRREIIPLFLPVAFELARARKGPKATRGNCYRWGHFRRYTLTLGPDEAFSKLSSSLMFCPSRSRNSKTRPRARPHAKLAATVI